jgi:hypothetical protein
MTPQRAAAATLFGATALFALQLLWTHGQLDDLRQMGRRGLMQRRKGTQAAVAADGGVEEIGARLNRLALAGAGSVAFASGSGSGGLDANTAIGTVSSGGSDDDVNASISTDSTLGSKTGGSTAAGAGGIAAAGGGMPSPAVIVFCYNRSDYLNQTLHSLLGLQGLDRYSVYVSQASVLLVACCTMVARAPWGRRLPALLPSQLAHGCIQSAGEASGIS